MIRRLWSGINVNYNPFFQIMNIFRFRCVDAMYSNSALAMQSPMHVLCFRSIMGNWITSLYSFRCEKKPNRHSNINELLSLLHHHEILPCTELSLESGRNDSRPVFGIDRRVINLAVLIEFLLPFPLWNLIPIDQCILCSHQEHRLSLDWKMKLIPTDNAGESKWTNIETR